MLRIQMEFRPQQLVGSMDQTSPKYSEFVQTKIEGMTSEVLKEVSEQGYTEVEYMKISEMPEKKSEGASDVSSTATQYSETNYI